MLEYLALLLALVAVRLSFRTYDRNQRSEDLPRAS